MTQEQIALLLEDPSLSLDDLATSCTVTREWVIEHVQAGVLPTTPVESVAAFVETVKNWMSS